jgi:hypothetical protein
MRHRGAFVAASEGFAPVEFAGRSMERAHRERRCSRDVSVDDRKPDRNVICALRHLGNSTPASLSASCYDSAISVIRVGKAPAIQMTVQRNRTIIDGRGSRAGAPG